MSYKSQEKSPRERERELEVIKEPQRRVKQEAVGG